jgi:hypothetical protein
MKLLYIKEEVIKTVLYYHTKVVSDKNQRQIS